MMPKEQKREKKLPKGIRIFILGIGVLPVYNYISYLAKFIDIRPLCCII